MTSYNPDLPDYNGNRIRLLADDKHRYWASIVLLLIGVIFSHFAWASPLSGCQEHFISSDVQNAPTLFQSAPDEPFDSNVHLCYRTDNTSFFALEYWPERFAPRWTAYRLDGEVFGPDGCNTYTRNVGNCYVNDEEWVEPFECSNDSDPFHRDHTLESQALGSRAFTNTGHDLGHIAPRQAFAWHVCGAYQTFTMANMSPQSAWFNRGIWANLEEQVLTWAVDHGPIYVVSGPIFRHFPHWRFSTYRDGALDPNQIYPTGATLEEVAIQMRAHADESPSGHILNPQRAPNPDRLNESGRSVPVPTGYFKVLYRPAVDEEPARAIGFLLPHSYERLSFLANHYDGLDRDQAFWAFASRIDLIEELSGIRFPGISDELKATWRSRWYFERRGGRDIRSRDCGVGTPAGVLVGAPREKRLATCEPLSPAVH